MSTGQDSESELQEPDGRTAALREAIRRSFPAERYTGKVTPHDGEWLPELTEENAILDDHMFLYEALNGRRWTEVPTQLLRNQPDGYVLLTDEAFTAFLPAWLMHSLEGMDAKNEVRDFLVYTFSSTLSQFRVLNPEQQLTVRSLLAEFAERESSPYVKKLAFQALALIDRFGYWHASMKS